MTSDLLLAQARVQDNVVACWALRRAGMTRAQVAHQTRELRELQDGVYLLGAAPPTRRQRWWAAVLTAPGRVLSNASGGAAWGFRPWDVGFEVVTAHGTGGPKRLGSYMLCHSTTLAGQTTTLEGLPITTAARTLADLAPHLSDRQLDRAVREALRLKSTTCAEIQVMLARAGARNRPRRLTELANRYARLPIARTRSDPEAHGLALLRAAGIATPRVNVKIAGEEADFSWADRRLIVELDGPDFHQFPDEDLRKQVIWEAAGWEVRRLPTDDVYDAPHRLLAAAS